MQSKDKEISGPLTILSLVLALPSAIWLGFAGKTLWSWFAVPLGVSPIGVWEAAGLILLARFLVYDYASYNHYESQTERLASSIVQIVVYPLAALAFGLLYHTFAS